MAVYRFRVSFEDFDDIVRDIEILATQTLEDFHYSIHNYIGFDASKPASFYLSDDNWKKGKEYTNRDLKGEEKQTTATLRKSRLCDIISDPHQKIYYMFDPSVPWCFHIELIKILGQEETGILYPRCLRSQGDAPKQYNTITAADVPQPDDFDEVVADTAEEAVAETEEGIEEDLSLNIKAEESEEESEGTMMEEMGDEMVDEEQSDEED